MKKPLNTKQFFVLCTEEQLEALNVYDSKYLATSEAGVIISKSNKPMYLLEATLLVMPKIRMEHIQLEQKSL